MPTDRDTVLAANFLESKLGPLTFGALVRVWRERREWTQVEAAKKLRVSKAVLRNIEKSRQLVSVELVRRIARRLGHSENVAIESCLQDQLACDTHRAMTRRTRTVNARAKIAALVRRLPERNVEAAARYLEYLCDFGDAEGPPDVERAWVKEIRRRVDALEAGKTQGEDWTKVRARLKRGERA